MPTITVRATVEVDLDEIEDEDIQSEFERRGFGSLIEQEPNEYEPQIREMFDAFKLGKTDKAMEIAKSMAQELTGGIL